MKKPIILHPFLFAILPILFLYSHNMGDLRISDLPLPLIIAAAASVLLWLLLALVLRDKLRAALLSTLFWIWFFSYGHIQILLTSSRSAQPGFTFTGALWFLLAYYVLLLGGAVVLMRVRRGRTTLSSLLNFVAVVLVAWHTLTIGAYEFKRLLRNRKVQQAAAVSTARPEEARTRPNIYYIVLDGYARADVLEDIYQFDNSDFLNYLTKKGFHVVRNGRANYCQTMLSLASSLNFIYLDDAAAQIGLDSDDRQPLWRMTEKNRLFVFLRQQGYRIVALPSLYGPTQMRSADVFITEGRLTGFSEFQECVLATTPILVLLRAPNDFESEVYRELVRRKDLASVHRMVISFSLRYLPDTTGMDPPVFVFAHIVCPHPPFLLDREGNAVSGRIVPDNLLSDGDHFPGSTQEYVDGYREQMLFVNSRIKKVVNNILARSEQPPIIILQADHGPGSGLDWENAEKTNMRERLGILFAYYLPDSDDMPVYDDLSPVNIFRIVLNRYFGTDLDLLPNESYYSTWTRFYRFIRVTDEVDADKKP